MPSKPTLVFTLASTLLPLSLFLLPLLIESRSTPQVTSQPFVFIKKLEGSQKGEVIKGLHQLKQYLEKFGYLPHQYSNTNSTTEGIQEDDDSFDDLLESAIKLYQQNFNLNITGKIDAATAEQMMIPRCGVPDVVNGKSVMGPYQLGSTHLHSFSNDSFFPDASTWPPDLKNYLTYGFSSRLKTSLPYETIESIFASAFARWEAVTDFFLQPIEDANNATIRIGFYTGYHGDGNPFDGSGGRLAHAYYPPTGVTHFDADEKWADGTSISPEFFHLKSVAVHEIGHLLGLEHSSDPKAVMHPGLMAGEIRDRLADDDIRRIRALYNLK